MKTGYSARVILDSVAATNDIRLTTVEIVFPRFILAEFNTHRMLSRNGASSRAIPVSRRIEQVRKSPFVPDKFGTNQRGMQAGEPLDGDEEAKARGVWLRLADQCVEASELLQALNVHKGLANRPLELFTWQSTIVTATEWDNLFGQRCHPDAQEEFRITAELMREAIQRSTPKVLQRNEWHMPYLPDREELEKVHSLEDLKRISVARCARVSVDTHDGQRDTTADVGLFDKLLTQFHMSPLEHVATPASDDAFRGNIRGWIQLRKTIPNEHDFSLRAQAL